MKQSNRRIKRLLDRAQRSGKAMDQAKALEKLEAHAARMTAEEWRRWFDGDEFTQDIRVAGGKVTKANVRRVRSDKRLWDAMSTDQAFAATQIGKALELITAGLGVKTNKFTFSEGGHFEEADWQINLISRYMRWTRVAKSKRLNISVVVGVLGLGYSCSHMDQTYGRRNGWAKQNLLSALDQYFY